VVSGECRDVVLTFLSEHTGRQPYIIARMTKRYSRITVLHALRALCADGLARFEGPDTQRRYFKVGRERN